MFFLLFLVFYDLLVAFFKLLIHIFSLQMLLAHTTLQVGLFPLDARFFSKAICSVVIEQIIFFAEMHLSCMTEYNWAMS